MLDWIWPKWHCCKCGISTLNMQLQKLTVWHKIHQCSLERRGGVCWHGNSTWPDRRPGPWPGYEAIASEPPVFSLMFCFQLTLIKARVLSIFCNSLVYTYWSCWVLYTVIVFYSTQHFGVFARPYMDVHLVTIWITSSNYWPGFPLISDVYTHQIYISQCCIMHHLEVILVRI